MSKIWTLTKVLLKLNYADFITDKKKRWAYVFSFATILFVGFLFGSITHAMYEGMIHLGQRSRNDYRNGTCDCEYMGIFNEYYEHFNCILLQQ